MLIVLLVHFMEELNKVSDHPVCVGDVAKRMLNLHRGLCYVEYYSVKFRILAAESG